MISVDFHAGMHISDAAKMLCEAADEYGEAAGAFNNITLTATRGNTAAAIVAEFEARTAAAAAAKAYQESPAGIAAEERRQKTRRDMQDRHDALMARLPSLDWSNDVAVLDWCCEMQEPSDHVGVIVRKDTILAEFAKHGFTPNMRTGSDYIPDSRLVSHAYLIGQAMAGIESVAIHSIIHKFAAEWKERFGIKPEGLAAGGEQGIAAGDEPLPSPPRLG